MKERPLFLRPMLSNTDSHRATKVIFDDPQTHRIIALTMIEGREYHIVYPEPQDYLDNLTELNGVLKIFDDQCVALERVEAVYEDGKRLRADAFAFPLVYGAKVNGVEIILR